MYVQETLPAFTSEQCQTIHRLLSTRVAFMMGRKFEEGDWADLYCKARGLQMRGWSNLGIDIINANQGIEQKMLCYKHENILSACGCTLMHPSLTRSIRIPSLNADPNDVMRDVFGQYAALLERRRQKVLEEAPGYTEADMRTGWLLWQTSLREFLYFEERTQTPDPEQYFARWAFNPAKGARKENKNLWIFEKDTGKKRYSVTTSAGAKIQPYFDVPAIGSPNLYHLITVGERLEKDCVRMWVTEQTAQGLRMLVSQDLSKEDLSKAILEAASNLKGRSFADSYAYEKACPLLVSVDAYAAIQAAFPGVNDDHSIQLLIGYLSDRTCEK